MDHLQVRRYVTNFLFETELSLTPSSILTTMPPLPFLERKSPLRMSYALLIMMVFFALMPAAFSSSSLSLSKKENNVKDWLPAEFSETAELEWFADHFAGESFVLATWEGCYEGDQRLKLFTQKLHHESAQYDPTGSFSPAMNAAYQRAKKVGNDLPTRS